MIYDFEGGIRRVLADVIGSFSPAAIEAVEVYLGAGEFALALEVVCAELIDNNQPIPVSSYVNIADLGERMAMSPSNWQGLAVF